MPITKSAHKALRQTKKRSVFNRKTKGAFSEAIKKARKSPTAENLKAAYSKIDRAVKKHLIHQNKGARMKSKLAKLFNSKTQKKEAKKPPKKSGAKKE